MSAEHGGHRNGPVRAEHSWQTPSHVSLLLTPGTASEGDAVLTLRM